MSIVLISRAIATGDVFAFRQVPSNEVGGDYFILFVAITIVSCWVSVSPASNTWRVLTPSSYEDPIFENDT